MDVSSNKKDAGKEGERQYEAFMDNLDTTSKRAVERPLTPISRPRPQVKHFWGGGIPE